MSEPSSNYRIVIRIAAVWLVFLGVGLAGVAWLILRSDLRAALFGTTVASWPAIEHLELDLDLSRPPRIAGEAVVDLSGIDGARVPLLLGSGLDVVRAGLEDGGELRATEGGRLASDYHQEGRVIWLELGAPPRDGRARIRIAYEGRGLDGSEGRDWRGILLLAPDELRMSEQTVFYPQFAPEPDGPGVARSTARLRVRTPAGFEVYAPGIASEPRTLADGAQERIFELHSPSTLSLVAGPLERREIEQAGARVVTLLRPEHAALAGPFAEATARVLEFYGRSWGPGEGQTLGVVEINGRGSSYNWAAPGLITFDRLALGDDVPTDKLAHEVAHLWWGGLVPAAGPGERFLTESLAEYSAWRFLEEAQGVEAARAQARTARADWMRAVHEEGADPALADVRFATGGYQALAYAKGPLVLRWLESMLTRERMDALLSDYAARGRTEGGSLELFRDCVRRAAGDPTFEIPWLEREGHAHLGFDGLAWDAAASRLRGSLRAQPCPEDIAESIPPRATAEFISRAGTERVELSTGAAPFDVAARAEPEYIAIDPDVVLPIAAPRAESRGGAKLVASVPADGASGVALGPFEARLTFDRPLAVVGERELALMKRAALDDMLESGRTVVALRAARLEDDGRVLVLSIEGTLPGNEHALIMPEGLTDAFGIPLPYAIVRFETVRMDEASRPRVLATDPAAGATGVPTDRGTVRVEFSEAMRAGRGFKTSGVRKLEGRGYRYPKLGDSEWLDQRTLVWHLAGPLDPATKYGLPFGRNYRDVDGNELMEYDLTFETAGR